MSGGLEDIEAIEDIEEMGKNGTIVKDRRNNLAKKIKYSSLDKKLKKFGLLSRVH